MKKLHIVHSESSQGWGGQEIRILTEAAGLIARGHEVSIICVSGAPIFREAQRRNIPVAGLPIQKKSLTGLFSIYEYLKDRKIDILNTHSPTDSWLVSLAALKSKNTKIIRTRHVSAPVPTNLATRWLYQKGFDHIVTTGEKLRQQLIVENSFSAQRISSIPTGVDSSYFVPADKRRLRATLSLAEDKLIVGITAMLRSWKGHRYLIEAIANLADNNVLLLIVGGGPQYKNLQSQIQQLNMSERVLMVGNKRDVRPWMQAMDIFVLPSYANEGVPQSIIQAMMCGLPVISTTVGSIVELVDHDNTGFLIDPNDAVTLAKSINQLLQDASLRKRFGDAGRKLAKEKFNLTKMLDEMEAIFSASSSHF